MTKKLLLFLLPFLFSGNIYAQDLKLTPQVAKAVYFDISPPLRNMAKDIMKEDRSWKDGAVPNKFAEIQPEAPVPDASLQSYNGILTSDTTIVNVDGIASGNSVPPDTYGEAGPNHYFQVVNTSYAIYNKAGQKIFGPFPNSSVWSGMPNNSNSGDAVVLYDETADRWIFTQFSLPGGSYYQMIAVSQTPDPTGPWYRWQYQFSSMPDYPKFGVWPDGYYMSSNNFGSGWIGNGAFGYDRTAMLAGDPGAVRISFNLPPGSDGFITLYPSDCDGTLPPVGTPNYFGFIKTGSPQSFGIYEFHADFANPAASTFSNKLVLPVTPFSAYIDGIPQLGTTARLETLADRLMYRLQYRRFAGYDAMVVNHSVNTGSGNSGVRWYEFRKTTGDWYIYQQSTYAPDNHYRWMGSIAMDTAGTIALGYSVSSSTMYPAVRYTGRHKNDPLNQMTFAERSIVEGGGCQTGVWSGRSRWGDYSGMSVDPAAPTTFWFTTEYYATTSSGSWRTRIGSFTYDNVFSAFAAAAPATLCQGDSSHLSTVVYGGSGNYTCSWTSIPAGFTSNQPSVAVLPVVTTKYIVSVSDGNTTKVDTAKVTVNNPPYVFAGNDTTVCKWLKTIELKGVATDCRIINWYSTGDGTFSSKTEPVTTYTFGPKDLERDSVDLILFGMAKSPCSGNIAHTRNITITPCTGITETSQSATLTMLPNPAREKVTIVIENAAANSVLMIIAMDGRKVYSEKITSNQKRTEKNIDLTKFPAGIYTVSLTGSGSAVTSQLAVE